MRLAEIKETESALLVKLLCEIDHHTAKSIREEVDKRLEDVKPRELILDFSGVPFMDSSGLGLIMGRYSLMQKLGGTLTLKNPNERLVKIFELAGLGRMIRIETDGEEEAK